MAFCHVYFWKKGPWGHTGLALQTPTGKKTYITMLDDEGQAVASSLPEELRNWTGIRGRESFTREDKHAWLAQQATQSVLRPGQRAQEVTGRVALGRRDSGGFRKNAGMSLVLAGGQIRQEPTEIIEIPVLTSTTFGVDTDRIFYWWRSYGMRGMHEDEGIRGEQTPRIQYKGVSARNNCAGTTALALIVGGATYFKSRARQYRVSTPEGVCDWAKEVRDAALEINRAKALSVSYELKEAQKKRTAFDKTTKNITQKDPNDLPTMDEWKKISYVGPFARRKEQIANIDNALRHYHEIPHWGTDHDDDKARQLDEIIRQAENHAINKPASDRLHAVTYMLAQAWKVLDKRLRGFREGEHIISRIEYDGHGSLRFTPDQFEEIFMGDEWLTEVEPVEIKVEEQDIDDWDVQEHRRRNDSITGSQSGLFASDVSQEYQPSSFASDVSKDFKPSFLERARRSNNHHRNTGSLGSL